MTTLQETIADRARAYAEEYRPNIKAADPAAVERVIAAIENAYIDGAADGARMLFEATQDELEQLEVDFPSSDGKDTVYEDNLKPDPPTDTDPGGKAA